MNERIVQTTHPLVEAHHSLMEAIENLEEAVRSRSGSLTQLTCLLASIRKRVLDHFRLEEEGGYMKQVLEERPFLERTVEKLLQEHRTLAVNLDTIIEELRTPAADASACYQRLESWTKQVRHHESVENLLVENTFSLDIGAKD
jgi:hemerythrin-like domain-containing protein